MTDTTTENSEPSQPLGLPLNDQLGQALEDAAYDCMSDLAGVDTHDMNLRDHPQAWAAIEAFAAKVRAAERERCAKLVETQDPNGDYGMRAWFDLLAAKIRA